MLLVAGLAGGLLAGAAGSAAAQQSAVTHAAGSAAGSAIPQPGGRLGAQLQSVRCTSSSNCWAVGTASGDDPSSNEALHWNGDTWSLASTPDPRTGNASLSGAGCISAADCWAVGSYGHFDGIAGFNLALHWNGQSWAHVLTPDPGGSLSGDANGLTAVTCLSAAYCWAVGSFSRSAEVPDHNRSNQILHWNGASWSAT